MGRWRDLANDPQRLFRTFTIAAIVCCAGIGVVFWADARLSPSLHQEVVTMVGLAAIALGLGVALAAHIALLVHRLRHAGKR